MRTHILGSSLLLGLAVLGLGAPGAWAAEDTEPFLAAPGELLVPGQELQIEGYCPDPAAGPLTSEALTNIQILHDPASGPPNLNAAGVVAEGTTPGAYPVTMDCAGQELRVTFTVIETPVETTITVLGDRAEEGDRPEQGDRSEPRVTRVPTGAPETGEGARGVQMPLVGLGVVLGAMAGAGAIVWRGVRR